MTQKLTTLFLSFAVLTALSFNTKAQTTAPATTTTTTTTTTTDQSTTDFKPSGKVYGQAFGDWEWKLNSDINKRGSTQYSGEPNQYSSFDLRRVYFGYEYNFAPKFTANVLVSYEGDSYKADSATIRSSNGKNILLNSARMLTIKAANLRWKNIFNGTDLIVGQQSTIAYATLSEKVWGYRCIEKTICDLRGIAGSSDMGISLQGRFDRNGVFSYDLMAADNTKTAPASSAVFGKKAAADLTAKLLNKKLIINVYGDYSVSQYNPYQISKTTLKAFVAYQSSAYAVGVEAFMQTAQNSSIIKVASTDPLDTTNLVPAGASVFGRGSIIKDKLGFFARVDMYMPDSKYKASDAKPSSGNLDELLIIAGLDYTPVKNVHFMPNIWVDQFMNQTTGATGKVKSDNDIVVRATFFYTF